MALSNLILEKYIVHKNTDIDTTVALDVIGNPGTIYSITIDNPNNAAEYVYLYDTATSPTFNTTAPKLVILANLSGTDDGQLTVSIPEGLEFSTGITCYGTSSTSSGTNPSSSVIMSLLIGRE